MEYIIYCRKSTKDEGMQHQSIPDQIKRCMEYAKTNDLIIKEKLSDFSDFETEEEIRLEDRDEDITNQRIYKETRHLFIIKEKETGKIPYKRKKRRSLIRYVKAGKIKGILSYSPDRQARNILE